MDVDMIFKIAAIGIIVAMLNPAFDSQRTRGAGAADNRRFLVVALMMVLSQISDLFTTIRKSTFGL